MRRFLITVNGTSYEVEVEEVSSFSLNRSDQPADQPAQRIVPEEPNETKDQPAVQDIGPAAAMGTKVVAPMPGKIISVKAGPGQAVKRGDVLMVLEAMKMENEIQAPEAGTVTAIAVSEGVNVNAGALLACIG